MRRFFVTSNVRPRTAWRPSYWAPRPPCMDSWEVAACVQCLACEIYDGERKLRRTARIAARTIAELRSVESTRESSSPVSAEVSQLRSQVETLRRSRDAALAAAERSGGEAAVLREALRAMKLELEGVRPLLAQACAPITRRE